MMSFSLRLLNILGLYLGRTALFTGLMLDTRNSVIELTIECGFPIIAVALVPLN